MDEPTLMVGLSGREISYDYPWGEAIRHGGLCNKYGFASLEG